MPSATVYPQNDSLIEEIPSQPKNQILTSSKFFTMIAMISAASLVILSIIIIPVVLTSKQKQDSILEMNDSTTTNATTIIELEDISSTQLTMKMAEKQTATPERNTNSSSYRLETTTGIAMTKRAYESTATTHIKSQSSSIDHTFVSSTVPMNISHISSMLTTSHSITISPIKLVMLNSIDDTMISVYNTTAGKITNNFNPMSTLNESSLRNAMDNRTSTSYLSDESIAYSNHSNAIDGVNSGFIVVPSIVNATIVCAVRFATGNLSSLYDPVHITLEGSNDDNMTTLLLNNTWALIYKGSTGINATDAPPRQTFGSEQTFDNVRSFVSYRLLITAKRGNQTGPVEYSEAQIIGYLL